MVKIEFRINSQITSKRLIFSTLLTTLYLLLITLSFKSIASNQHEHQSHADQGHSDIDQKNKSEEIGVDKLSFENFYARASIGKNQNSVVYGKVTITSGSDILIKASSSASKLVKLHRHLNDNGVMRMREVNRGFKVAKDRPLVMKPSGYHIMLMNLFRPLLEGSLLDIELTFASGAKAFLTVPVVSAKMVHRH